MKYLIPLAAVSLLAATAARADDIGTAPRAADTLSYTNVGLAFVNTELGRFDGNGLGVRGSWGISDNIYVVGQYAMTEVDVLGVDVDFDTFSIGGGWHGGLSERADLIAEATFESFDVSSGGQSFDDTGYGIRLGIRGAPSDRFELMGYVRHVDVGGDDTLLGGNGVMHFTDTISGFVEYETGDDLGNLLLGARFDFH